MLFKRKPKNRRFAREHVLEVKMHSQHVRAARLKLASTIFAFIVGAAVTLLVLWRGSERALNELVFKNSAFNITELDIQTDGVIPVPQIRAWAGVKAGDNLFTLDLPRIERDLELQPLIQNAVVVRTLPRTLRIRIVEREPIAQISGFQPRTSPGDLQPVIYHLDETGHVMHPLAGAEFDAAADVLPAVTGVRGTELQSGKRIESPQMQAALRLIAAFARSPMAGLVDLKSIDLSSPQVLVATTRQGNEITFPLESLDKHLRRWRTVHDFARQEGRAIATLDLSVANNVPARWQEAGVAPAAPPKPIKPSRYKKKHA